MGLTGSRVDEEQAIRLPRLTRIGLDPSPADSASMSNARVADLRPGDVIDHLGPFVLRTPLRVSAVVPVVRGPWACAVALVDPESGRFKANLTAGGGAAANVVGVPLALVA